MRAKTQLCSRPASLHRINVLTYLLATDEEAAPAEPSLQQMLNLRQQLEAKAKIDKMYRHKNPNFIEWPAVQRARVKAIEEYNKLPKATPPAKRIKQLNDLLCLLFHSLQPPDRVGCVHHLQRPILPFRRRACPDRRVIRRLRFGTTLCKERDGSWVVDLTRFRHKTSKVRLPQNGGARLMRSV